MNLPYRIGLLSQLGEYMLSADEEWEAAKDRAYRENNWFIPEFVEAATRNIATEFLNKNSLERWLDDPAYAPLHQETAQPLTVGIVMAGNIPLVGFHDWLSVFISGNKARVKPSARDQVLITHLLNKISSWSEEAGAMTAQAEMLKSCDAYIATGSNNSSRYFEYYFNRFPHIIRRNRTSVSVLTGNETTEELVALADDVYMYFGLGCRNVTKIYVPENYDFVPLLEAFRKYNWMADHHKYKNNYDYNLAIHLLNKNYYMTNGSILLIEDPSFFSPISQLNYEFYAPQEDPVAKLTGNEDIQCLVGKGGIPFGLSQRPQLKDYADGVDSLSFLAGLARN
jgi:hypothetical protein